MSQALLSCHDIVRMICRELRPVYLSEELPDSPYYWHRDNGHTASCRKAKQALLSTAQVSRILSHHAVDTLWEVLEGIGPLLQVLPSFRPEFGHSLYLVRGRQSAI